MRAVDHEGREVSEERERKARENTRRAEFDRVVGWLNDRDVKMQDGWGEHAEPCYPGGHRQRALRDAYARGET